VPAGIVAEPRGELLPPLDPIVRTSLESNGEENIEHSPDTEPMESIELDR
jgi:hypothetical protein